MYMLYSIYLTRPVAYVHTLLVILHVHGMYNYPQFLPLGAGGGNREVGRGEGEKETLRCDAQVRLFAAFFRAMKRRAGEGSASCSAR